MADRVADRFEIIDLLNRHAFALDDKDFERLRDVFTADAVFSEFPPVPMEGIEAIVPTIARTLSRFGATQHLLGPVRVEWDGEDAAHTRCYIQATHEFLPEKGGGVYTLHGTYIDDLVRTGAGWRIAHRRLYATINQTIGRAPRAGG